MGDGAQLRDGVIRPHQLLTIPGYDEVVDRGLEQLRQSDADEFGLCWLTVLIRSSVSEESLMTRKVRIGRSTSTWLGVWTGIALAGLGTLLVVSFLALGFHASRGTTVREEAPFDPVGSEPMYVVGVSTPGAATGEPVICSVFSGAGGTEMVEVGTRDDRYESIPAGRRLPSETVVVACDRRVSVSTGLPVLMYPVAGSQSLLAAYIAIAALGYALIGRALRLRRAYGRASAAPTGQDSLTISSEPVTTGAEQDSSNWPGPSSSTLPASRHRPALIAALVVLVLVGTIGMLIMSAFAESWARRELVMNLLLLLVVLPAAIVAGALLPVRRKATSAG